MIIQSAVQNKEGRIIVHKDRSPVMIGTGDKDLTLTDDSTLGELVDRLIWGTFGNIGRRDRKNNQPSYVRLADMESEHLEKVWRMAQVPILHKWVIERILKQRKYWPKRLQKKKGWSSCR